MYHPHTVPGQDGDASNKSTTAGSGRSASKPSPHTRRFQHRQRIRSPNRHMEPTLLLLPVTSSATPSEVNHGQHITPDQTTLPAAHNAQQSDHSCTTPAYKSRVPPRRGPSAPHEGHARAASARAVSCGAHPWRRPTRSHVQQVTPIAPAARARLTTSRPAQRPSPTCRALTGSHHVAPHVLATRHLHASYRHMHREPPKATAMRPLL
jgi:hypothetical protein